MLNFLFLLTDGKLMCVILPVSALHCGSGDRKDIQPVKSLLHISVRFEIRLDLEWPGSVVVRMFDL